jgi:hypothetical protein
MVDYNDNSEAPKSDSISVANEVANISDTFDFSKIFSGELNDSTDLENSIAKGYPDDPVVLRFLHRGMPLVDNWPTSIWPLSLKEIKGIYYSIGYPDHDAKCVFHPNPAMSTQIISSVQLRGYGSNLMTLAGDITYAYMTNKRFVMISRRYQKFENENSNKLEFSTEFENAWSFSEDNDTMCVNWNDACEGGFNVKETCKGPTHLHISLPLLQSLRFARNRFFLGSRVELFRLLTRLRTPKRRLVDENIRKTPISGVSVAIHIRRTDKFIEHSPTAAVFYVEAGLHALAKEQEQLESVVVMTDDTSAALVVIDMWNKTVYRHHDKRKKPTLGFFLRDSVAQAKERPDESTDPDPGTINMMSDLKLLVLAKYFVGTQSSNFGLTACYLRGGVNCFNAEEKHLPYHWDHMHDKLM